MTIIIVFELLIFLFLYCIARIKVAQIPPDTLLHRLRRNATWIDSLSDEELDAMTYCTCFLGVPDPWCPMHGEFPPYVFGHGACNTGVAVAASEESDVAPREAQKTRCQRCGKVAADVQPSYGLCKLPERHLLCDGCYAELVTDLQRRACPDLPQQDLAERGGFEPPIPFRVCRFSRPEPSTTRPPLRLLLTTFLLRSSDR